jgi:pyrimidine operon attenuation protein/uracil phosphoribosyltransferase
VGKNIPTSLSDSVNVRLTEIDDRDEVELQSGGDA